MVQRLIEWFRVQYRLFCLEEQEQHALEREYCARKDMLLASQKIRRRHYKETGEIKQYFR